METKLQELDGKLRTLKFAVSKSNGVIETGNLEVITRHEASITAKIEASHTLKEDIVELKFSKEESEEQVQDWVKIVDEQLKIADEQALELRRLKDKVARENRALEKAESDKQEMALEKAKHELKMSRERELLEQQLRFQKSLETGQQNQRSI